MGPTSHFARPGCHVNICSPQFRVSSHGWWRRRARAFPRASGGLGGEHGTKKSQASSREAGGEEARRQKGRREAGGKEACREEGRRKARGEEARGEESRHAARGEEARGQEGRGEARGEAAFGEEGSREARGRASHRRARAFAGDGRRPESIA